MATIKLIDVPSGVDRDIDGHAVSAADKWMSRIEELFITERAHQLQIGISEVGMECRKCVARKLALTPRVPDGSWYPFIGTAVHDQLEKGFNAKWPGEYNLEERLYVHSYKELKLTGSCDMGAVIDMGSVESGPRLVVNDWKVVGNSSIADARKGKIKDQYRVQAMLYGYGWKQKGYDVTHVALSFLPREDKLENAVVILLRYDEELALNSLAQLESMIDAAEIVGWDAVIEKQPKAGFCFSCRRYEQTISVDIESLI